MRKKPARGPRGRSEWGAVQALDAKVNRFFKNLEPRPSPVLTPGTVSRPRANLVTRMKLKLLLLIQLLFSSNCFFLGLFSVKMFSCDR